VYEKNVKLPTHKREKMEIKFLKYGLVLKLTAC